MTTDLNETRLQVLLLPVNIYVEDTVIVSRLNKSKSLEKNQDT